MPYAALGWAYIVWLLARLLLLDKCVDGGQRILLAMGMGIALSDPVTAFTAGKHFGRQKLAPRLSPNKTWEGAGSNVAGTYAGIWIMSFAVSNQLRWC